MVKQHVYFGSLKYDIKLNWYEAKISTDKGSVIIYLSLDECQNEDVFLSSAASFCADLSNWRSRTENFATEKLLSIKNESWHEDDEAALTSNEFRQRLSLESIKLTADERFDFYYNDGDLFWGHTIQVRGTVMGGPSTATIAG